MARRVKQAVEEAVSYFDAVHTPEHPYCDDLSCRCHVDIGYHEVIQYGDAESVSEEETAFALSFLMGQTE